MAGPALRDDFHMNLAKSDFGGGRYKFMYVRIRVGNNTGRDSK